MQAKERKREAAKQKGKRGRGRTKERNRSQASSAYAYTHAAAPQASTADAAGPPKVGACVVLVEPVGVEGPAARCGCLASSTRA